MADRPRRKKKPAGRRKKRPATTPHLLPADLDLGTMVVLSVGEWSELADFQWPPEPIQDWLDTADVRQVRGLLLATLQRWHQLRPK